MTRYDQIWPDMTRYDQIWPDMIRYDQIWPAWNMSKYKKRPKVQQFHQARFTSWPSPNQLTIETGGPTTGFAVINWVRKSSFAGLKKSTARYKSTAPSWSGWEEELNPAPDFQTFSKPQMVSSQTLKKSRPPNTSSSFGNASPKSESLKVLLLLRRQFLDRSVFFVGNLSNKHQDLGHRTCRAALPSWKMTAAILGSIIQKTFKIVWQCMKSSSYTTYI